MDNSDNEYSDIDNNEYIEDDEIEDDEQFDKEDEIDNQVIEIANEKLFDITSNQDINLNYNIETNTSTPYLTKYEYAKIVGLRAQQIASGAKPRIKVPKFLEDVVEIAEIELKERKTPFMIKRDLPSGKNEFWKLSDMIY